MIELQAVCNQMLAMNAACIWPNYYQSANIPPTDSKAAAFEKTEPPPPLHLHSQHRLINRNSAQTNCGCYCSIHWQHSCIKHYMCTSNTTLHTYIAYPTLCTLHSLMETEISPRGCLKGVSGGAVGGTGWFCQTRVTSRGIEGGFRSAQRTQWHPGSARCQTTGQLSDQKADHRTGWVPKGQEEGSTANNCKPASSGRSCAFQQASAC